MNQFDFAASVIKASPLARLTDRAFIVPVLFVCVVWLAALNRQTSFDNAIDFTKWVLGTFVVMEKGKDAVATFGALSGNTPQALAVGSMETKETAKPVEQMVAESGFDIRDHNIGAPTDDEPENPNIEVIED